MDLLTMISLIMAVGSLIGTAVTLLTFIRNTKKRYQAEGVAQQRQAEMLATLQLQIEYMSKELTGKIQILTDQQREMQTELKNANARMIQLATFHAINHPGQTVSTQ